MTHERLLYLAHLIDRVNTELNVYADISYGQQSMNHLHISMFYVQPTVSRSFWESDGCDDPTMTNNDKELVKAEAFLRGLLRSAKYYPQMRPKS